MAATLITGKSSCHDERGDGHRALERVAFLTVRVRLVVEILAALLLRHGNAFGSRAESPQQRIDGERDDAEHRDLAERVEAAEVHQDDVHDVGAAALRVGVLDKEARDAVRRRAGHDHVGKRCQSRSRRDCDGESRGRDTIG